MQAANFDLDRYFERIGYTGAAEPTRTAVAGVMSRQLRSVPFENLDVQAGRPISLVPEVIVEKIVHRRRGGYCYEVNGLFAMAMTALGASWRFVGCRPMIYPARRPRTHMALLVMLEGEEWLCDTGFGSYGLRAPIRLGERGEVRQDHDRYRLAQEGGEYVLRAWTDGGWADQYGFDLTHHEWIDFLPANWLNSTHPETIFTQHRIVVRQTPEGRVALFNDRLKTHAHGREACREVGPDELPCLLRDLFGLEPEENGGT